MMIRNMETVVEVAQCIQIAKKWIQASDTFHGVEIDDGMLDVLGTKMLHDDAYAGFVLCGDDSDSVRAFICGKLSHLWFARERYTEDIILCKAHNADVSFTELAALALKLHSWGREQGALYTMYGDTLNIAPKTIERIYTYVGADPIGRLYKLER